MGSTPIDRFRIVEYGAGSGRHQGSTESERPLEQELRNILIDAARPGRDEVLADMDRIRAMTPKVAQADSAELIREDRDLGWR